jgi:hypothetical protein
MRTASILLLALSIPAQAQEGRTKSRLLYSFEVPADLADLKRSAENSVLDVVADNGVTHGKSCARWVVKKGADYGVIELGPAARKDWRDFDYFAIDVYMEEGGPSRLVLELWDPLTKGYPTRCTYEDFRLRPGRQTLLYPIGRAKRNSKEGRDWEELEPKDKIDLARLTKVKLFLSPPKDRDAVLWIDNLRLLQEDAAKPKLKVPLPKGAIAFKFGSAGEKMAGFTTVAPGSKMLSGKGLVHGGTGWPDALSGTFVMAAEGERLAFSAPVPNGTYSVYYIAGPIHRRTPTSRAYRLSINGRNLGDISATPEGYYSTSHLFRFLDVDHDGDPASLWRDYVARMYPSQRISVVVKGGHIALETVNHFLSAIIMVPDDLSRDITSEFDKVRREAFEKTLPPVKRDWPRKMRGDGPAVVWEPPAGERVWPWTHPRREKAAVKLAAAPGQAAHFRLGLTTFTAGDLKVAVDMAGVKAPVFDQRLRFDGEDASEMCLVPAAKVTGRAGQTKCLWLRVEVPADAKAGKIDGSVRIEGKGIDLKVPVTLEVLPIKVDDVLPLSLGMYYSPHVYAGLSADKQRALYKGQLQFMRSLGMTACPVGTGTVTGLRGGGKTALTFDPTFFELAKEIGFGRHPMQYQMGHTLGIGRGIGRRMSGSIGAKVDQSPGIELKQPGFRSHFLDALGQYRAFIEKQKLPVAVEIVDEPREIPNPWNRNLADTIAYARMVKEAGLTGFITPMGDSNSGKDYSVLADEADILSVHGGKGSAKLMARATEKKRKLWLYNTGMDRFSWGFYAWRVGAVGRWEWHFSWSEDKVKGGYPGQEWYNPFTSSHGLASDAPVDLPGGILYQSAFFDVAEGITDHAYLLTLERLIAGKDTPAAKEARAFLAALKKAIPMYPEVKGLADADAGALVGAGIKDDARLQTPKWRAKLAEHIAAVSR